MWLKSVIQSLLHIIESWLSLLSVKRSVEGQTEDKQKLENQTELNDGIKDAIGKALEGDKKAIEYLRKLISD